MEKLKALLKTAKQNEMLHVTIILIFGCYIFSALSILIFFWNENARDELVTSWLLYFPLILLLFSPAFLLIYKDIRRQEPTIGKIFFSAIIIPFLNLVYFYIEIFMSPNRSDYSNILAACWLFLILPSLLFVSIFIPNKIFKFKKEFIITTLLTGAFGVALMIAILPINFILQKQLYSRTSYWNPITSYELKAYNPTIKYLEDYKNKNGVYPENISNLKPKSEAFPYYIYETFNERKDFVLSVRENDDFTSDVTCYKYCSNKNLKNCTATGFGLDGYLKLRIKDWIYYTYILDD